jgi:hypothetical protein
MSEQDSTNEEAKSRKTVDELSEALTPLVDRLTPEIEPAVVYTLRP